MSDKYRAKDTQFNKLSKRFFTSSAAFSRDIEATKEVWRQVSSFAGFSFSKAHSASFAVESSTMGIRACVTTNWSKCSSCL